MRSLLILLLVMTSLSGCVKTNSETLVAAPTLYTYSPEFQAFAAKEVSSLPSACDRLEPAVGCSAMARLAQDYLLVRDQVRLLQTFD